MKPSVEVSHEYGSPVKDSSHGILIPPMFFLGANVCLWYFNMKLWLLSQNLKISVKFWLPPRDFDIFVHSEAAGTKKRLRHSPLPNVRSVQGFSKSRESIYLTNIGLHFQPCFQVWMPNSYRQWIIYHCLNTQGGTIFMYNHDWYHITYTIMYNFFFYRYINKEHCFILFKSFLEMQNTE